MKFGLIVDHSKKEAVDLSAEIEDFLFGRGHFVERNEEKMGEVEVVIVLGGDGTLLHSACSHIEKNIPFVGINLGRLGFLTAAEAVDWQEAIERLILGRYIVSARMTLDAAVIDHLGEQKAFRALNEAVIRGSFRIIDLDVNVGREKFLAISGDGLIVATQTGSTAYSLSAGGPIVDPHLDCFVVTPINAHGLPIPSVVISPEDNIEILAKKGEDMSLVLDGQEHTLISQGDRILISKGKYRVKFIYFDKHQFLKSLNSKFGLAMRLVG